MNDLDKIRIIDRYNQRLAVHGATIATMASGTEARRDIRFRVMTEIGLEPGDVILDLGCGFGDFVNYLDRHKLSVDYVGYDINPALVEVARARYPERRFEVRDVLHDDFPEFDYILSSSCFNLPLQYEDNYEFVKRLLYTCYKHVRKGVSIDFLSSYVDFHSKEGFHYDPEKVFKISKSITKRVNLRHDYPLFEFNMYLYKDFQGWSKD